jgi:hypothetical protein
MAIPKFKIWVLQNFCSKNFKNFKFWVCNFLTITKIHLLLEHISTLKPSLHMIFVNSVLFKIQNFKILLKKFQNFKTPKMACTTSAQTTIVSKISALYLLRWLKNRRDKFCQRRRRQRRVTDGCFFRSKHVF